MGTTPSYSLESLLEPGFCELPLAAQRKHLALENKAI